MVAESFFTHLKPSWFITNATKQENKRGVLSSNILKSFITANGDIQLIARCHQRTLLFVLITVDGSAFTARKITLLLDFTFLIVFDHLDPEVIFITCHGSTPIFWLLTLKLSTGTSVSCE